MSSKNKEVFHKDSIVQAVLVMDTFDDEFFPLTNDMPVGLFPLLNKPLLEYSLEYLSYAGVEEVFLFCCFHGDLIKEYVKKRIDQFAAWSLDMKVHILVSECCRSFGDCLRDLDAKGLLRNDFILLDPGVVANIKLLPILQKHKEIVDKDKGAAITLIYQESGIGQIGRSSQDEVVIVADTTNRILFYKKVGQDQEKKIEFPLEMALENSETSILHNLKDNHIAICSSSVLPLFSDNFDFQTKDDFIRGLLMNEEIMGSTVYLHILKGTEYGGAVTNWQNYQGLSWDVCDRWTYPLVGPNENRIEQKKFVIGKNTIVPENSNINRCIIGNDVVLGQNVDLQECFIMSNCKIGDNVTVNLSIVGPNCRLGDGCKVVDNTVLGKGVELHTNQEIRNELIQEKKPDFCTEKDILGKHAFRIKLDEDEDVDVQKIPRLRSLYSLNKSEELKEEDWFSESDEEELSYTQSPAPDDTKLFLTEVIDSLTRGFDDKVQCENLILEINSSRYAYNVTVAEVNFNVIKAILLMYFRQPTGRQYLLQLLGYFIPILKNYIRNDNAMIDCLQAVEDVAITNENVEANWVGFVLQWLYSKDILSEEIILKWGKALVSNSKFTTQVQRLLDWLEQSSSEDE